MTAPSSLATPAASPAAGGRRRATGAPRGLWVFADQGVVSLANFAAPVIVARCGGQTELGYYTLGFSIYLFVLGLARAMVWTPYTRRAPTLDPGDRAAFAGSATIHLAVFCAAACLVLWGGALAARGAGYGVYAWLLTVLGPCVGAMLLREHLRRLGLARLDFYPVFVFDLVVSVAQVGLLLWLKRTSDVCATRAFACLAATSLLAAPWLATLHGEAWRVRRRDVLPDWRVSWSVTKWLTAGAGAVLLGKEGYNWLLGAVASIAELGRLGAARVVVQLTNPIVIGGQNYLGPVSAKVYADHGVMGLWRHTVKTTAIAAALVGAFLALVYGAGVPAVRLVFEEASAGVTPLLLLTLTAGVMSEVLLIPIEFASVNLGKGRLMFQTALVRLGVNATLGFGLVGAYGAEAIGVGMLLGSAVAFVWQWGALAREVRRA